ncbi:hypothetical protein [Oceanobacillus massiliensis]|uniref:hypothetical protein n=2 Tax=Oceanobacillus massiliensis TaxID=1465765 RepID=UPI001F1AB29B|nr:hypothetical protein [Oceanobacillus massiliensis]
MMREAGCAVVMEFSNFIYFITIGNIGVEEHYVYVLGCIAGSMIIYFFAKPLILKIVNLKLYRLLSYLISSLIIMLSVFIISFLIEDLNRLLIPIMKVTVQSISFLGMFLAIGILIQQFIRGQSS